MEKYVVLGEIVDENELREIRERIEKATENPHESELLMLAMADLDAQREIDKTEQQLAMAELAEVILGGML